MTEERAKELLEKLEKWEAVRAVNINVGEMIDARKDILTASQCDQCKSIVEWILERAITCGSCAALGGVLAGIFALADIVFFELDEILVPVEAVMESVLETICEEFGFDWLKNNLAEAAKQICEAAKVC